MNINSYNVTDVSYHYIGLRVLDGVSANSDRSNQLEAISRNVLKFVNDKALRLMLPEPRGTFQTVGEKICQELVHFKFAQSPQNRYELTQAGKQVLALLADRKHAELRRLMISVHLQTYDNLRSVVETHLTKGPVWRPIVTSTNLTEPDYLEKLLEPTFGQDAAMVSSEILEGLSVQSPKKIEDALRAKILLHMMPSQKMGVALFRSICDRLVSLRLLNKSRATTAQNCEFEKTYSPCVLDSPPYPWHTPLPIALANGDTCQIYLSEPDMTIPAHQEHLMQAIDEAFTVLKAEGGYYDIPELRDWVCEYLMIPEAAFDNSLNQLLDQQPPMFSVGLQYDRITSQRHPLVRTRQSTQLHNIIRRLR